MNKVEINGIYYNLNEGEKTAEVTENPNKYSGAVSIPETVSYNGITYSVTSIGDHAFNECTELASVNIPGSVTCIGNEAFRRCRRLTSVNIPNYLKDIRTEAFRNCSGLTSINIPNSVTSIGESAFQGCDRLTSVNIPNSVTCIGKEAFLDCPELASINVETGNRIYDSRNNCNAIIETATNTLITGCKNTTIPNSVTSIGKYAFWGCKGLTSINIPDSVTGIKFGAFLGCPELASIKVETGNRIYDSRNNCNAIIETATNTLVVGCKNTTIPDSVTRIGDNTFYGCSGLTSVTIPNSVTSIGRSAFSGCSGLTSVNIPNSVTSIKDFAFCCCSGLTSITIPNSVTSIGGNTFEYCKELTDVYCHAENVPRPEFGVFINLPSSDATLHVPVASIEQYKTTVPWSGFSTIVATDGTLPEPFTPKKCATPTISYRKGKLSFSCETEGAEFISEITDTDIKKHYTASVSLTATYNICVYATKADYENSDTIQATLCWIEQQPQTEGITDEDAAADVQAVPVLIQTQGNTITVQGAEAGAEIILYGANSVQLDSVITTTGNASLNTSYLSGPVAIVKIGNKTVKVLIK